MGLKYGLVGCGEFGHAHATMLYGMDDVELIWAADVREERLKLFFEEFHISRTSIDYRELLNDPEIKAVSIITHIHTHSKIAIDALRAGKHVLVEKPMATSLEEANRMVAAARQAGKKLYVSQSYRWSPCVQTAKKLIKEEDLGAPLFARLSFTQWLEVSPEREEPKIERCVIFCHGVHLIDLARWLLGREAISVSCLTKRANPDFIGDTTAFMLINFEGDIPVVIELSFASKAERTPGAGIERYEFENGLIEIGKDGSLSCKIIKPRQKEIKPPLEENQSLWLSIRHFIDWIEKDIVPVTTGEDNLGTISIMDAAYRSADKKGEMVKIVR